MKHYRLDFGEFIHHDNGIFEVIINEGVELDEEKVNQYFELARRVQPKIKLCLVNRKNKYSYTFKANLMLATTNLAEYAAIVKYNRLPWPMSKLMTPKFYKLAFFDNYEEATLWLLNKTE